MSNSFIALHVYGSIFICVRAFIFLMFINIIRVPEENFNVPHWVVPAVGMAFALSGTLVTMNGMKSGFGDHTLFNLTYNALVLMLMILFADPFHWVALGSGEHSFIGATRVGLVSFMQSDGGDTSGHIVFGLGAILMDIFIIHTLYRIIRGENHSKSK